MDDIDEQVAAIEALIGTRLRDAAHAFAAAVAAALPKDTGGTAAGVSARAGAERGRVTYLVNVPFPWQFVEFGTARSKPNPVVRRTLYAMRGQIEPMIAGE